MAAAPTPPGSPSKKKPDQQDYTSLASENEILRARLGQIGIPTEGSLEQEGTLDPHRKYEDLLAENDILRARLTVHGQVDGNVNESNNANPELVLRCEVLACENDELREQLEQLLAQTESTRQHMGELSSKYQVVNDAYNALVKSQELASCDSSAATQSESFQAFEDQPSTASSEMTLESSASVLDSSLEIQELKSQLTKTKEKSKRDYTKLKARLVSTQRENESLKSRLTDVETSQGEADHAIPNEMDSLLSEKAALIHENESLKQLIQEHKDEAQRSAHLAATEVASITTKYDSLVKEYDTMKASGAYSDLHKSFEELSLEHKEMKNNFEKEKELYEGILQQMETQCSSVKHDNFKLKTALSETKSIPPAKEEKSDKVGILKKQNEELDKSKQELSQSVEREKVKKETALIKVKELESKCKIIEAEREEIKSQYENQTVSLADVRNRCKELELENQNFVSQLDTIKTHVDDGRFQSCPVEAQAGHNVLNSAGVHVVNYNNELLPLNTQGCFVPDIGSMHVERGLSHGAVVGGARPLQIVAEHYHDLSSLESNVPITDSVSDPTFHVPVPFRVDVSQPSASNLGDVHSSSIQSDLPLPSTAVTDASTPSLPTMTQTNVQLTTDEKHHSHVLPDEITLLKEKVASLTLENDALIQNNAILVTSLKTWQPTITDGDNLLQSAQRTDVQVYNQTLVTDTIDGQLETHNDMDNVNIQETSDIIPRTDHEKEANDVFDVGLRRPRSERPIIPGKSVESLTGQVTEIQAIQPLQRKEPERKGGSKGKPMVATGIKGGTTPSKPSQRRTPAPRTTPDTGRRGLQRTSIAETSGKKQPGSVEKQSSKSSCERTPKQSPTTSTKYSSVSTDVSTLARNNEKLMRENKALMQKVKKDISQTNDDYGNLKKKYDSVLREKKDLEKRMDVDKPPRTPEPKRTSSTKMLTRTNPDVAKKPKVDVPKLEKQVGELKLQLDTKSRENLELQRLVMRGTSESRPASGQEMIQMKIQYEILMAEKQAMCTQFEQDKNNLQEDVDELRERNELLEMQLGNYTGPLLSDAMDRTDGSSDSTSQHFGSGYILQEQLDELSRKTEDLSAKLASSQSDNSNLQQQLYKLNEENKDLVGAMTVDKKSVQGELEEAISKAKEAYEEKNQIKLQFQSLMMEHEELKSELDSYTVSLMSHTGLPQDGGSSASSQARLDGATTSLESNSVPDLSGAHAGFQGAAHSLPPTNTKQEGVLAFPMTSGTFAEAGFSTAIRGQDRGRPLASGLSGLDLSLQYEILMQEKKNVCRQLEDEQMKNKEHRIALRQLHAQLEAVKQDRGDISTEHHDFKMAYEIIIDEKKKICTQLDEANSNISALTQKLKGLEKDVTDLNEIKTQYELLMSEKADVCTQLDSKSSLLSSSIERISKERDMWKDKVNEVLIEREKILQDCDKSKKLLVNVQRQFETVQSEKPDTIKRQAEIQRLSEQIGLLKEELEDSKFAFDEMSATLEALQKENDDLKKSQVCSSCEDKQPANNGNSEPMSKELEQHDTTKSKLMESLKKEIEAADKRIARLEQENKDLTDDLEDCWEGKGSLRQQVSQLQLELLQSHSDSQGKPGGDHNMENSPTDQEKNLEGTDSQESPDDIDTGYIEPQQLHMSINLSENRPVPISREHSVNTELHELVKASREENRLVMVKLDQCEIEAEKDKCRVEELEEELDTAEKLNYQHVVALAKIESEAVHYKDETIRLKEEIATLQHKKEVIAKDMAALKEVLVIADLKGEELERKCERLELELNQNHTISDNTLSNEKSNVQELLEVDMIQLNNSLTSVKQEKERLLSELKQKNIKLVELEANISDLTRTSDSNVVTMVINPTAALAEKELTISELECQLTSLQDEFAKHMSCHKNQELFVASEVASLTELLATVSNQSKLQSSEIVDLLEKNKTIEKHMVELRELKEKKDQENTELHKQICELKLSNENQQKDTETLQACVTRLEVENKDLLSVRALKEKDNIQLHEQIRSLNSHIQSEEEVKLKETTKLHGDILQIQERTKTLEEEKHTLLIQLKATGDANTSNKATISELQSMLMSANEDLKCSQSDNARLNSELDHEHKNAEMMQNDLEELAVKIETSERCYLEEKANFEIRIAELSGKLIESDKTKVKREQLDVLTKEQKSTIDQLNQENTMLLQQKEMLDSLIEENQNKFQNELSICKVSKEQVEEVVTGLKNTDRITKEEKRLLSATVDTLRKEITIMKEQYEKTEAEKNDHFALFEKWQSRADDAENELLCIQRNYSVMVSLKDESLCNLKALEKEFTDLTADNNSLKQKLQELSSGQASNAAMESLWQDEKRSLQASIDDSNRELAKLKEDHSTTMAFVKANEGEKEMLVTKQDKNEQQIAQLIEDCSFAKAQLEITREDNKTLATSKTEKEKENVELIKQTCNLEQSVEIQRLERAACDKAIANLELETSELRDTLQDSQTKCDEFSKLYDELRPKYDILKRDSQKDLGILRSKVRDLQNEAATHVESNQILKDKIDVIPVYQEENNKLKAALGVAQASIQDLQTETTQNTETLVMAKQASLDMQNNFHSRELEYRNENEEIKHQLCIIQHENKKIVDERDNLEKNLCKLEETAKEVEISLETKEAQLAEYISGSEEFKKTISELDTKQAETYERFVSENQQLEKIVVELKQRVLLAENTIKCQEEEIVNISDITKSELQEKESVNLTLSVSVKQLENLIEEQNQQFLQLQERYQKEQSDTAIQTIRLTHMVETLNNKLEDAEKKYEITVSNMEGTEKTKFDLLTDLQQLQAKCDLMMFDNEDYKEMKTKMENELKVTHTKHDQMEQRLTNARDEYHKLQSDYENTKVANDASLQKVNLAYEHSQLQLAHGSHEKQELSGDLDKLQKDHQVLKDDYDSLADQSEKQLLSLTSQIRELTQKLEGMEKYKSEKKEEIDELHRILVQQSRELEQVSAARAGHQVELGSLMTENSELRDKISSFVKRFNTIEQGSKGLGQEIERKPRLSFRHKKESFCRTECARKDEQ